MMGTNSAGCTEWERDYDPVTEQPTATTTQMMTAQMLRACVAIKFAGMTHVELGRRLGLSAGFIGMVLSGAREPSKAFLEAVGVERITLYRIK